MEFSQLGLSAELLRAVEEQGYIKVTPIQQRAIPLILEGRDLLAGAQTGTGKTAGFTLPLLQRLQLSEQHSRQHAVRALILVPTRELAAQVADSVANYGRHLPYKSAVIFGGVNIKPQISKLRNGVDIVVATPGRLLDHMQRGSIRLDAVETLVLDEADRMLDMGFIHDIRKIMRALPAKRQNLLFSATVSREISKLAKDWLNSPAEVQVAPPNTTAEQVAQVIHPVDKGRKRELLVHLVGTGNWRQVLVFTRTKHLANRLSRQLQQDGLSSAAIHGNKTQGARTRALADFKRGTIRVLVATDIAARGLDIDLLPHVVNYELPNVPEDYIHRIGRTGRAGQDGQAVSLVCAAEAQLLADIEGLLERDLERVVVAGYEPDELVPPAALRKVRNKPQQSRRKRGGRRSSSQPTGRASAQRSVANGGGRRRKGPDVKPRLVA